MADLNNTLVRGNLRVTSDADISGNVNASTFNGLPLSGSTGANTIPIRDSNGYVYFNYINTNVGTENPASYSGVSLLFTGSDGWIRKSSPSNISVGYADSAGAVAWANVSDRPTDLGDFSNNAGYITLLDIPTASTSRFGLCTIGNSEQYDSSGSLIMAGTVAPQGHTHSNYLTNAIVSASVSGNTLTLSPQSGSAVTFTPTFTEQYTGTVKSVNGTSPDSNGNVSITIPTNNNQLTNGAGYITAASIPSSLPANGGNADYATSSTRLYASDSPYRYGDSNPYYAYMTYNSTRGQWYLCVYPESPKQIYVDNALNADYATSAGSVTWLNVIGKPSFASVATSGSYNDLDDKPTIPTVPTNISSFTNDVGYITSSGSCASATSAGSATVADNVSYIDARSNTSNLPSSANTSGQLKFVLCASEPSTKYDGYVYLILS